MAMVSLHLFALLDTELWQKRRRSKEKGRARLSRRGSWRSPKPAAASPFFHQISTRTSNIEDLKIAQNPCLFGMTPSNVSQYRDPPRESLQIFIRLYPNPKQNTIKSGRTISSLSMKLSERFLPVIGRVGGKLKLKSIRGPITMSYRQGSCLYQHHMQCCSSIDRASAIASHQHKPLSERHM